MRYLAEHDERLRTQVMDAIDSGLELASATCVWIGTPVTALRTGKTSLPAFVVDADNNIHGIITAFDLL